MTTTYNWDASGNLIKETTSGSSTYFYWVGGDLVGLKKNNTTYIVHDNLRGDVESITDTSGNIVAQAHYDPWGNCISSSGSLVQPMRYAGYYYDDETGLYYLKSRYYSPTLGRFLTRDGIKYIKYNESQTLNLYSYCKNNPVSNIDPTGQSTAVIGKRLSSFAGTLATLAAVMGVQAYLQKMDEEIEKLKQRVEGPQGEQYSLRATHSGEYTNVRGGTTHLEAGDVWKYGETTNPSDRYSDKWLTESGLYYYTEFTGTQLQCKVAEKEKIYGYFITNWSLPPGNKIFR